jgi:hypothetical protein
VKNLYFPRRVVFQGVPLDVQVLPTNKGLYRTHFQATKGIFNAETILSSVLTNLASKEGLIDKFEWAKN